MDTEVYVIFVRTLLIGLGRGKSYYSLNTDKVKFIEQMTRTQKKQLT